MIKLFRNIRQNLLNEGKTAKYFKYAIGEIVLVVIGILIALQVNTWKEDLGDKRIERSMMKNLNSEFTNNLDKLKESRTQYVQTEISIRLLMSSMQSSSEELKQKNIDSLFAKAIDVYDYRPTQNALTEILASGNLKLLTNDSLKSMLFQWSAELNEKEEAWQTLDDFNQNMVIPYLTKNASMRNIDSYSILKWKKKSKFNVNHENIFNDIEFENNLDNLAWGVINYETVLERLEKIIEQLIILTDD